MTMTHLPNLISLSRIVLAALFPFCYCRFTPVHGLFLFLAAGLSDLLDGWIARKSHHVTPLGTALDPLADKLMLLTVMGTLAAAGRISRGFFWLVAGLEAPMILVGLILYFRKTPLVIPANLLGKGATLLFFIAVVFTTFDATLFLGTRVFLGAIFLKILAMATYFREFRHKKKHITSP
jgi:cardiolipin synthase